MITIQKSKRRLTVTGQNGETLFVCAVMLGASPVGRKTAEGDGRTPEGTYRICTVNPKSRYHAAFGLNYPNRADAQRAYIEKRISLMTALRIAACDRLRRRPPWKTPLGGYVMIHGESPDGKTGDWTAGCVAVNNDDMDRLTLMCRKGETVVIRP